MGSEHESLKKISELITQLEAQKIRLESLNLQPQMAHLVSVQIRTEL